MKIFALIILQLSGIQASLISKIKSFEQKPEIQHGIVAAAIQNTSTGTYLLEYNADKSVNSASTLKLITTAYMHLSYGSDFQYKTTVSYSGDIKNNVLEGDIIIDPSGDPSFGSFRYDYPAGKVLSKTTSAIKNLGITAINGQIKVSDKRIQMADVPDSWIWGDMGNYYGAAPQNFNFNENLFTVYFNSGPTLDSPAGIQGLDPYDKNLSIINHVTTGPSGSGDNVYIYTAPYSETVIMKGTIPYGARSFAVKGALMNPSNVFIQQLSDELKKNGISLMQNASKSPFTEIEESPISGWHPLCYFEAPPLKSLMKDCNYESINLYADAFLLKAASKENSSLLTFAESLDAEKDFWESRGVDISGFNPKDGSGLSMGGIITPKNMCDILSHVSKTPDFLDYLDTIAKYGEGGTVKNKDRNNITQGRVYTKSGSISGTRAYAGYFYDKTGELYTYMFCVNRYDSGATRLVRAFLDDVILTMASK